MRAKDLRLLKIGINTNFRSFGHYEAIIDNSPAVASGRRKRERKRRYTFDSAQIYDLLKYEQGDKPNEYGKTLVHCWENGTEI